MKHHLLSVLIATAVCGSALLAETPTPPATQPAQPPEPDRPARGEIRSELKRLSSDLGLDETQKKEVRAILRDRRAQIEKLAPEQRWDEAGKRVREDSNAKIRAVLHPEQQGKFDKWVTDMKAKHHGKGRRHAHPPAEEPTAPKAPTGT